jgi:membrane associated rhomboid family serine protease
MTRASAYQDGQVSQGVSAAPKPVLLSCPATTALIATNIVVSLLLPIIFKRDYPANPLAFGAVYRFSAFPRPHEWRRLVASSFVHIELGHLVGNMVGLWIFGRRIEKLVGSLGVGEVFVPITRFSGPDPDFPLASLRARVASERPWCVPCSLHASPTSGVGGVWSGYHVLTFGFSCCLPYHIVSAMKAAVWT